jgi:hypothetical protein
MIWPKFTECRIRMASDCRLCLGLNVIYTVIALSRGAAGSPVQVQGARGQIMYF